MEDLRSSAQASPQAASLAALEASEFGSVLDRLRQLHLEALERMRGLQLRNNELLCENGDRLRARDSRPCGSTWPDVSERPSFGHAEDSLCCAASRCEAVTIEEVSEPLIAQSPPSSARGGTRGQRLCGSAGGRARSEPAQALHREGNACDLSAWDALPHKSFSNTCCPLSDGQRRSLMLDKPSTDGSLRLLGREHLSGLSKPPASSVITIKHPTLSDGRRSSATGSSNSTSFGWTRRSSVTSSRSTACPTQRPSAHAWVTPVSHRSSIRNTIIDSMEGMSWRQRLTDKYFWRQVLRWVIMSPESRRRRVWESLGMGFACMDALVIPFDVGFSGSLPQAAAELIDSLNLSSTVFWSLDIPISFLSGYHDKGVIEMRPTTVAWRYVTSWFPVDASITSLDWILRGYEIAVASSSDAVGMRRLGRAISLVRFLRLLRLLKVRGVLSTQRFHSERRIILGGLVKTLVFVLMINHVVACLWYGSAVLGDSGDMETWIEKDGIADRNVAYRYLSSLHWSLTQFTPASMEIVPVNALERSVAVVVILGGMLIFSSIVSIITNAMTRLRNLDSHKLEQTSQLRRFLQDRGLSQKLSVRIWCCLPEAMQISRNRLREKDVLVLKMLPSAVRMSISYELHMPVLATHPFFHTAIIEHGNELAKICQQTTEEMAVSARQELFNAGDLAERMLFIVKGEVLYAREPTPESARSPTQALPAGSWCCEQALWVVWTHVGSLSSVGMGEVLALHAKKTRNILLKLPEAREYARRFTDWHKLHLGLLDDCAMDMDTAERLAAEAAAEGWCQQRFSKASAMSFDLLSLPSDDGAGR